MRPLGQLGITAFFLALITALPSVAASYDSALLIEAKGLALFDTAAGEPTETTSPLTRKNFPAALIRKIQQGLADQGFFLGAIDGVFGPKTEQAIRAYQKSADLFIDGSPSQSLAMDLVTGGKVGQLLKRLKKTREASTQAARKSLLSRPETRNFLEGATAIENTPHNSKSCMAQPEPKCLLIEASMSASHIKKPEMRDWALGEILTSQARAGLAEDAIGTTRRIHDPRLIMVALREIAKAQAIAGQTEAALAAVDIIPDLAQQLEAYVAIAEIQARLGQVQDAAQTSKHLINICVAWIPHCLKLHFTPALPLFCTRQEIRTSQQNTLKSPKNWLDHLKRRKHAMKVNATSLVHMRKAAILCGLWKFLNRLNTGPRMSQF